MVFVEEPVLSAEVEDLTRPPEDGGEDVGGAGDPPRVADGQEVSGVGGRSPGTRGQLDQGPGSVTDRLLELGGFRCAHHLFGGHGDDDGGGDFPGELLGV